MICCRCGGDCGARRVACVDQGRGGVLDYIDGRLAQLMESVGSYKKPPFRQKALFCVIYVLPVIGMLLLLWLVRPAWLREQDNYTETQLFRSLGEWIAFSEMAGAFSLPAVFVQAARLCFFPAPRNRNQFAWLAFLMILMAISFYELNRIYRFY